MKLKVLLCVCSENSDEYSVYTGMPCLKVTSDMNFWEAFCPNCGRGGLFQYKSAYLALKAWNVMQEGLRSPYSAAFYEGKENQEVDNND